MVEWKKIKELFETRNGYTPSTSNTQFWEDGTIPWFKMEDIRDNGRILSDSNLHITPSAIKGKGLFKANSIILATSATIGEHALITVEHLSNQRFTNFYPKKDYLSKVDMKFVFYYMFIVDEWCKQHINHGGFASVDMSGLYSLSFPIPSLAEQERIVGILDTFTASIDNLKEQIAQRRKQYEHYRDQLLDIEGKPGVEMKTLGEIGKCIAGATPSTKERSYWDNGTIPWMSSGEVHQGVVTHTASFITQKGYDNASTKMLPICTVVIALAGQGKTRGTVAITAIELCTNQSLCGVVIDDDKILNKYVFFYLKTRYNDLRRVSSGDGTRGGLNLKMIGAYPIPIPPLSEQQRIVSILDTFEASIANLEAQLAERQKQYEYYRNKLLTFD